MIFEKQTGISLAVAGCIGALVLVVTGVLSEKQAYKAIDSQTIFIFGGTLALAKALEMTVPESWLPIRLSACWGTTLRHSCCWWWFSHYPSL